MQKRHTWEHRPSDHTQAFRDYYRGPIQPMLPEPKHRFWSLSQLLRRRK